ncbi:hypothetical protein DFH06DRAFT_57756 [Mycena polygramma]|nr:hypothetical protein DFH06DRAFT_57756 [Mycena polygramma]
MDGARAEEEPAVVGWWGMMRMAVWRGGWLFRRKRDWHLEAARRSLTASASTSNPHHAPRTQLDDADACRSTHICHRQTDGARAVPTHVLVPNAICGIRRSPGGHFSRSLFPRVSRPSFFATPCHPHLKRKNDLSGRRKLDHRGTRFIRCQRQCHIILTVVLLPRRSWSRGWRKRRSMPGGRRSTCWRWVWGGKWIGIGNAGQRRSPVPRIHRPYDALTLANTSKGEICTSCKTLPALRARKASCTHPQCAAARRCVSVILRPLPPTRVLPSILQVQDVGTTATRYRSRSYCCCCPTTGCSLRRVKTLVPRVSSAPCPAVGRAYAIQTKALTADTHPSDVRLRLIWHDAASIKRRMTRRW